MFCGFEGFHSFGHTSFPIGFMTLEGPKCVGFLTWLFATSHQTLHEATLNFNTVPGTSVTKPKKYILTSYLFDTNHFLSLSVGIVTVLNPEISTP